MGNFHDAVLLYATALNETVNEFGLEAKTDGEQIIKKMWNRTITGVTGNVTINENGDRNADYSLLDMDPKTGNFKTVAVYHGLTNEFKMVGRIHWPARNDPPSDKPECGINNELCDKNDGSCNNDDVIMMMVPFCISILTRYMYIIV